MGSSFKSNKVEPTVKSIYEYNPGETFEQLVIRKFRPYENLSKDQIIKLLGIEILNRTPKIKKLSKAILGVSKKKVEEFEKADIQMKTIKFEKSGALKESMSFSQIQYKEIINEDWEDSYWYNALTKRFFFVVFQKNEEGQLVFKKVFFWTMSFKDLQTAKLFWEDTKRKILNNDFQHFIKISDKSICHVRPKGKNGSDLMETITGSNEKKKCYWLNASFIKSITED